MGTFISGFLIGIVVTITAQRFYRRYKCPKCQKPWRLAYYVYRTGSEINYGQSIKLRKCGNCGLKQSMLINPGSWSTDWEHNEHFDSYWGAKTPSLR